MEGQGKRLLLAVALALGVLLAWNWIFPSSPDEPPKPTIGSNSGSGSGSGSTGTVVTAGPKSQFGVSLSGKPAAPTTKAPSTKTVVTNPKFAATFSSKDAVMSSWKLLDARYERDESKGELVGDAGGSFDVDFWYSTITVPRGVEWTRVTGSDSQKCEVESDPGCTVAFKLATPQIELTKTYTVVPDAYLVKMSVSAKLVGSEAGQEQLAVRVTSHQKPDTKEEGGRNTAARLFVSSTLRDGTIYQTPFKEIVKQPRWEPAITWSGFEHPYLLAGYAPKGAPGELVEKHTYANAEDGLMWTDLVFSRVAMRPGDSVQKDVVAYLGPKNYADLDRADSVATGTDFKATIDLGWFAFIGRPLLWLLLKFQSVVGNWGIAIILLTFLVKLATLYWTTKSMRSMKAMAALSPQLKIINEKYKDDRQRIQAETMALYKQHNVNPIAGCLPILLQMPIWIALYRMLSSAGELYMQPFIPGWIDDLTATDPYHILPVVLVITMFLQARLTPQTGDSRQQKFLQYGMPLMFGVMSFFFPAGLTLYIFTNTCLSALHSIYMNKYDKKSLEIAAKLKANQAAAKAAEEAAKKPATKKPVIDAKAVEKDEDDDDGESPSNPTPSSRPNPGAQQRPKRKKRKR